MNNEQSPLNIAQISDMHLQHDPMTPFRGYDVESRFLQVLAAVQQQSPDLALLTGDLVHHGSPDAYQRLAGHLGSLSCPVYWIPGNHDDPSAMQSVITNHSLNTRLIRHSSWQIILLDSTHDGDGCGSGAISDDGLLHLQQSLFEGESLGLHQMVILHHNPLPVTSVWQNRISLINQHAFWEIAEQYYASLKVISCGHLHYPHLWHQQGIRLFSAPATAPQFQPDCEVFQLETDAQMSCPGWRTFRCYPDGTLQSRVHYLPVEAA